MSEALLKQKNTKKLKVFKDQRGYLFEALRNDDKIYQGKFGQVLISTSKPGTMRAWHMHEKQTDYTCCIKGKILLTTAIENKKGKTKIKKYILGENKPRLVRVPPNTWHGYKALGKKEAVVLYVMDKAYNAKNPDEQRKPLDAFGKDIWKTKK